MPASVPAALLTYDEALARILAAVPGPLPAEAIPLSGARGRALAEDVFAGADLPPFDNSAVDGFAVRVADTLTASAPAPVALRVMQTVAAGRASEQTVLNGQAARIFTGAAVPPGADGLVMVEDTRAEGEIVFLFAQASAAFIRRAGSDIARAAKALEAGETLEAGSIGLLSALNQAMVFCPRLPRIGLLTTGDEVIPPGPEPLRPGQIRDANGPALAAAIQESGSRLVAHRHARDTEADVRRALDSFRGDSACDVILASGGVSVGDLDFVKSVAAEAGALDFWRVAIKPGKPLAFGHVHGSVFFGLPGNPVSSLVTFELFVRPLLRKLAGHAQTARPRVSAELAAPLPHAPGRREFVRARLAWRNDTFLATPTGSQASHRLASLTGADALLIAHEDHGDYAPGDRLPALLL